MTPTNFCDPAAPGEGRSPRRRRRTGTSWAARTLAALLGATFVFAGTTTAPAVAATCPTRTMIIVAHTDDDLLFLSPDLLSDAASGCVRAVFTTAGEAGEPEEYWGNLEDGIRATYAQMAGVTNAWTTSDAGVSGRDITMSTLTGAPGVSLVFMRLPDGNGGGEGFDEYGNQSIYKLWNGQISSITAVDGSESYTNATLGNAINELVADYQPTTIRTTRWTSTIASTDDHSDHWTTAQYARQAFQAASLSPRKTIFGYQAYEIADRAINVSGTALTRKTSAFLLFSGYDMYIHDECPGGVCTSPPSPYDDWINRQYIDATLTNNVAPTASAGPDQDVDGGAPVNLTGGASADGNGDPLTFAWSQTAGTPVTLTGAATATPTFVAPNATGALTFRLVVSDGVLSSAPDTVTIDVTNVAPNQEPTADAGDDSTTAIGVEDVPLSGSGSTDPDTDPLTYAWTQTGGPAVTLTGADTVSPTFDAPLTAGTLTFSLVVNDGRGGSDDDTVDVTVVPFSDVPPDAFFFADIDWLYDEGITRGSDGPGDTLVFGASDPITREAMAAFVYRFNRQPAFTPPTTSPFTDLPYSDPLPAFYPEITWLEAEDIEPGGGAFTPSGEVTRGVMAVWVFRALTTAAQEAAYVPSGTEPFTDVDPTHPLYKEISWMYDTGLSTGADDGNGNRIYAPDDSITREAMAAFFHRADTAGFRP